MPSEVIRRDADQACRCSFMKIVPPDSLRRLANDCFIGQHNFTKHGLNMPVDTASRSLQLRNQFGRIIFKGALCNLTAESASQHHNLESAQFVTGKTLASEWLKNAYQPTTAPLPWRNLFLLLSGLWLALASLRFLLPRLFLA